MNLQKITPFLWFDNQAEEAVNLYVNLFPNSKITKMILYPEGTPGLEGTLMTLDFELDGQKFTALNGGPMYQFSHGVSFSVNCESQAEVDFYWEKLTAGGTEEPCGWLIDRFGLSWQIVPHQLIEMIEHQDKTRSSKAVQAMLQMKKIIIADLEQAFNS